MGFIMNDYFFGTPYDMINAYTSRFSPSTVHVKNTQLAGFYFRYLFQKAISVFKWTLPDIWDRDYFLYVLYLYGIIGVFNSSKFGVIPQICTPQGFDIFYRPKYIKFSNSNLPLHETNKDYTPGKDSVLFKLQPDYIGICDLISYYADMMAIASETIAGNIFTSKLAYVFAAGNKTIAESLKKAFDSIMGGEPATFIDASLLREDGTPSWNAFDAKLKNNYIATDVIGDLNRIESMFDTDIGIPNANTDKRERLIKTEVESNNVDTKAKAELWLEHLKKSCDKCNELFNIGISVDWRFKENEPTNTPVNYGAVQ